MNPLDTPPVLVGSDPMPATEGTARSRALYRTMWRWHFFAGLVCIPVIVLLCLSGLVWLFKPQLWDLQYGHLQSVVPAGEPVSYARQLDAVQQRYPGSVVTAVHTPPDAARSTIVDLTTADGQSLAAYVDPYRAAVLGHRDNATDLASIALELHGSLMTGRWLGNAAIGDGVIEIVAGWALVLLITGTYLWWPRDDRGLRAALRPRLHMLRGRIGWRDVHAVTGVLFAFAILFFLVTGMAWTGVWGPRYLTAATTAIGAGQPQVEQGSRTLGELLPNGRSPWAMGNVPLPASTPVTADSPLGGPLSWDPAAGAPLDAVVAAGQKLGLPHGFSVTYPDGPTGSYGINYWEDGPQEPNRSTTDTRVAYIDRYTAQPISQYGFADYGWAAKATSYGIALHEGRQWGLIDQILVTIAVVAILVLVASSLVMWRKRRPRGLGAPNREPQRGLGLGLLVAIVALGVLFPLLGASMVVVVAVEFLVIRRVPVLARAFGTT
jgi:uncharacterized iron-regulated membrane protein